MKKILLFCLAAIIFVATAFTQTQYTVLNNAVPNGSPLVEQGASVYGIKFRSNQSGYIVAIKFYKGVGSTGQHVAAMWSGFTSSGTLMDSVTFSGETSSGWQTQYLRTPVAITANADYMASVSFEDVGAGTYMYEDLTGFTNAVTNGPLTVVANGGAYFNGAGWLKPIVSLTSNFYVDVIFQTSLGTGNILPTVSAGPDRTVASPATTALLSGLSTDPDGTISSRSWTKISGPAGGTILSASSDTTTVNALVSGVYGYRLSATDNSGGSSADTVYVYVNQNQNPVANAGFDQTITGTTATLTGQGFDPDGSISTYAWTQVSGPSSTISSPSSASTGLTGLSTAGTYVYRLTVTDNSGATGTDDVIVVKSAGGTVTFTPTTIPFSSPDIISPGRGAEQWHGSDASQQISNPTESSSTPSLDIYHRSFLEWDRIETAQGVYDFSYINQIFNDAILAKRRVGFGIMSQNPFRTDGPFAGGAYMSYPLYLHSQMQSLPANERDWISAEDAFWIPNYNSEVYLSRFEALLNAIATHINNTSFNGVRYRDVLGYVDIRGYGSWGEWNMVFAASNVGAYPTGRRPLAASLIRIINAHITAFPNNQLVALMATFDGNQYDNIKVPPEVGYHALTASNNYGKIGWRWDSWGWTDALYENILGSNPTVYNGMRFDTAITNRSRYALVGGEGPCGGTVQNGPVPFWAIPGQVRRYGAHMIGNGNFCGEEDVSLQGRDSMRLAWKLSGYRYEVSSFATSAVIANGQVLSITTGWKNVGVSPTWENWNVTYELQDQTTGVTRWTGTSAANLRAILPSSTATSIVDNFTLPSNIPIGTYRLVVKVVDPRGYRDPLPLAITNRRSDGSYEVRNGITISAVSQNTAPTANAGTDKIVVLPASSTTLAGSGTDPDGTISSYQWSLVSAPSGGVTQDVRVKDLVVFMGESNAQGRAVTAGSAATTTELGARQKTRIWNFNSGSFSPLDVGTNNTQYGAYPIAYDGTHGWEIGLANAVDSGRLSDTVYLVKMGAGGTRIDQWLPGQSFWNNGMASLDAAISNMQSSGVQYNLVFWVSIGLNDAIGGTPSDSFGARMTRFFNAVRQKYGTQVQFHMTQFHRWAWWEGATGPNGTEHPYNPIIDQLDLQQNVYVVETQGATFNPGEESVHWDYGGLRTIATTLTNSTRNNKVGVQTGGTIVSPNNATTNVIDLYSGTWTYRLTVTDNVGATATDDVLVTVGTQGNQTPVVNAGADQAITLPTNTTVLSATASDPDGTISSVVWAKVSGTGSTIVSPTSLTTNVTGLSQGTYQFRVTVTDNFGQTATDNINVVVNAAPNQLPTVNAGLDQVITLPTSTVTLTGTASDLDGTISSYAWTKTSGPAGGNITTPSALSTGITALAAGLYTFRLTVTDNSGASASDFVNVQVNPAIVGTAYVTGAVKTWGVETPTPRLRVRISFTDGTTQTISQRNGAYVVGVRGRYKFLEGANRFLVIINYSDNTVQEIYKK